MWLVTKEDIVSMYTKHPSGELTFWCDGRCESETFEEGRGKRKRESTGKRMEREEEVDTSFKI